MYKTECRVCDHMEVALTCTNAISIDLYRTRVTVSDP